MCSTAYLVMVSDAQYGEAQHNKYYKMQQISPRQFQVEYGRIGATSMKRMYSMDRWNDIYESKIDKGYEDVTKYHQVTEEVSADDGYKRIENPSVKACVDMLLEWANKAIKETYTVTSDQVTRQAVLEAQGILNTLSCSPSIDIGEFNRLLKRLFTIIPRRMPDVDVCLAKEKSDYPDIISREQDELDMISTKALRSPAVSSKPDDGDLRKTILEANSLKIRECSEKESEKVKNHLDPYTRKHFKRCWHAENEASRERFNAYCKKHGIGKSGIRYLYHGSRNQNYWNILVQSLKLRPTAKVQRSGAMFGYGLYFAPSARKSAGYTSMTGSAWAHGGSSSAMLMVFKVAMGKPKDMDAYSSVVAQWDEAKCRRAGYDSVSVHGSGLHHLPGQVINDECIVYNEDACTISYLIELEG